MFLALFMDLLIYSRQQKIKSEMLGLVDSFNFHLLYLCSTYRTISQLASFSSSSLCQVWGETVCLWQFLISVCESDSCNHTYALSLSSPCRYYAICCQPLVYRNKMTPMRVALMIGGCWVIPTFISFLPIMQGWNSIGIDHLVSAAGWRPRGRGDLFHKFVEVKAARGDTKTSQRWKKAEQNMFSVNILKKWDSGKFCLHEEDMLHASLWQQQQQQHIRHRDRQTTLPTPQTQGRVVFEFSLRSAVTQAPCKERKQNDALTDSVWTNGFHSLFEAFRKKLVPLNVYFFLPSESFPSEKENS